MKLCDSQFIKSKETLEMIESTDDENIFVDDDDEEEEEEEEDDGGDVVDDGDEEKEEENDKLVVMCFIGDSSEVDNKPETLPHNRPFIEGS